MNEAGTEKRDPPPFSLDVPGAGLDEGVLGEGELDGDVAHQDVDTVEEGGDDCSK